jgi:hypothetical protein
MKLVCETATLRYSNPALAVFTPVINPEIHPAAPSKLAHKVKTGGNMVYKNITATVAGLKEMQGPALCTQSASVFVGIAGNTQKVKADGEALVRDDAESAEQFISGTLPNGAACVINTTVQINTAGQNKVDAI